jgi:RNA polymerase sigma factor (TIGR02999 family)
VREVPSTQITGLLLKWRDGDQEALHALMPLVYGELRRLARQYLRKERPDHTLRSTALVHEAYLRLEKQGNIKFENRSHFLAICAQLMRQILVDYARGRGSAKRNGGFRLALDDIVTPAKSRSADLLALDDALTQLGKLDPQQSRIVELRFFGGLSIDETSEVLGVSSATIKREWATAKIWLHREMNKSWGHDA